MKYKFIILATAALTACGGTTTTHMANGDARVASDLAKLREATAPYRNLDAAVAAGYPRTVKDCLIHEHHGAMGYHHVNSGYVDKVLDITKPEILLYERDPKGAYRLNAVEFIVPYRLWPKDSVAPVFMGQTLRHENNLNIWYLHVWAWKQNPEGLFANFHPDVKCSPADAKVFMPSGD
jgi:hypothetical protein